MPDYDKRIDELADLIDQYGWPVDIDRAVDRMMWRDKTKKVAAAGPGIRLFFPARSELSPFMQSNPEWEGFCVIKAADGGPRNLPKMQVFDAYGSYICTVGPRRRKEYFFLRRVPQKSHPKALIHTIEAKEGDTPGTVLYIYVPMPAGNAG